MMMYPIEVQVRKEGTEGIETKFWFEVDADLLDLARKAAMNAELKQCASETDCLDHQPEIHVGGNGVSGSGFIDHAGFREYVHQQFEAKLLDMESSTVAHISYSNNVPFIAFRSLSDLAGGGEGENQIGTFFQFAANNAASVVESFLDALPAAPEHSSDSKSDEDDAELAGGLIVLALALAYLGGDLFGGDEESELSSNLMSESNGNWRIWRRNLSDSPNAMGLISGTEVGAELKLKKGTYLSYTLTPNIELSELPNYSATNSSGEHYSVGGGWRGENLFTSLKLTHADWNSASKFINPVTSGNLAGQFNAKQTDLRIATGAKFDLPRGSKFVVQGELFTGNLDKESYRANGAYFSADLPEVTEQYQGWKTSVGFRSSWKDTDSTFKTRSLLQLSALRVNSESDSFRLNQTSHIGLFGVTSQTRFNSSNQIIYGLNTGMEAKSREQLSMKLGYAVYVDDDNELHQAVAAGVNYRF